MFHLAFVHVWDFIIIVSQVVDDHIQTTHIGKPCSVDILPWIICKGLLDALNHLTLSHHDFILWWLYCTKGTQI